MIFPYDYIPDPTRGRPLFFGQIYIGLPDTDPTIPGNEKSALLIQENGSSVPAEYPITTSAGGVPQYNGSSVAISVTGSYSIAILDNQNDQVYYLASAGDGAEAEFLVTDLRSIMFDHGYLYNEIGIKLVTGAAGVELDGALTMLDVNTGAVWDLPDDIPPGAVVVSLIGSTLTTNIGQFELVPAPNQSSLLDDLETGKYNQVQNRWVDNQNFNVLGKDGYPLLDAVPQDILAGNEIAAGIIALTDCLQMTKINGAINSASNTGIIQRSYPKDDAGEITKESQYGGFKNHVGDQIEAVIGSPGTGGAEISDDASNVYVDVDLSIATDGLQFLFLADEQGIIENVSDHTSARGARVVLYDGAVVGNGSDINLSDSASKYDDIRIYGKCDQISCGAVTMSPEDLLDATLPDSVLMGETSGGTSSVTKVEIGHSPGNSTDTSIRVREVTAGVYTNGGIYKIIGINRSK